MALVQASAPTGRSQVDDAIATQFFHDRWQEVNVDPYIGLRLMTLFSTTPESSNSLRMDIVVPNEFTGAAAVADNDAAPEEALETTVVSLTGAKYGLRSFTLDLAMRLGIGRPLGKVQDGLTHAHMNLMHTTALALFNSFSASTGSASAVLDFAAWDTITALHKEQNHGHSDLWACFHGAAIRQLKADLRTSASALYGSAFGDAAARALKNTNPNEGISFDGYTLYQSNDCPVGDTTGRTGGLGVGSMNMEDDENACLGRVAWEMLDFEAQRDASRFGLWTVAGTTWAIGIVKNGSGRNYIHSAS